MQKGVWAKAGGEAAGSSVGRPSGTLGFREVPLRAVREGWLETKGLWDWVGFLEVPLRAAREGWMETRGP